MGGGAERDYETNVGVVSLLVAAIPCFRLAWGDDESFEC